MAKSLVYPKYMVFASRLLELLFFPLAKLIKHNISANGVKKVLIIEPFGLGDAVSLAIMLDPLREKFPLAEIHMLLKPANTDLYLHDDRVTQVHLICMPWIKSKTTSEGFCAGWYRLGKFIFRMRRMNFDIGIDTRGEIRSQILLALLGCPLRVGFTNYLCSNLEIKGKLLTHNAGNLPPQQRPLINLSVIRLLGCAVDGRDCRLHYVSTSTERNNEFTVLCHTGAGWKYRYWDISNWTNLIKEIVQHYNVKIVIICDSDQSAMMHGLRKALAPAIEVICPTSLNELIVKTHEAHMFIGIDSGPMHLACAMGKPVVALFGPGVIDLWHPYGTKAAILHRQDKFSCSPCLQKQCLHPHATCINAISFEEVFAKVKELIPVQLHN